MPKSVEAPVVDLSQVEDEVVRKNFENISNHFEKLENLNGFNHLEFTTDKAVSNLKVAHNLGYAPKDIIVTCTEGVGTPTFNTEKFDKKFIDVDTTDAVTVRLFVGTQGVEG